MSNVPTADPAELLVEPEISAIIDILPHRSSLPEDFRFAVIDGIRFALHKISDDYDGVLEYHDSEHFTDVVTGAVKIITFMHTRFPREIPERDIWLVALAAAGHDIEEEFDGHIIRSEFQDQADAASNEEIDFNDPKLFEPRILWTGSNEINSADEIVGFMVTRNLSAGREIFTGEDIERVLTAIRRTVPEIIEGSNYKTVRQDTARADAMALAMLWADANSAGYSPDRFLRDGDRLWVEKVPLVGRLLRNLGSTALEARERTLDWYEAQVAFARGRAIVTAIDIDESDLPDPIKNFMRTFFSKFHDSTAAAQRQVDRMRVMGYGVLADSLVPAKPWDVFREIRGRKDQ